MITFNIFSCARLYIKKVNMIKIYFVKRKQIKQDPATMFFLYMKNKSKTIRFIKSNYYSCVATNSNHSWNKKITYTSYQLRRPQIDVRIIAECLQFLKYPMRRAKNCRYRCDVANVRPGAWWCYDSFFGHCYVNF